VQRFKLIPYAAGQLPRIEIIGEVERRENRLFVRYDIRGDVGSIHLPAFSSPARKDDLWRATCFEFFVALPSCPEYWEFNMSPSSEWNVYHMDAYRQVNMQEETRICQLPFTFQKGNEISLDISIDLNLILQADPRVQLGITAIIQTKDGSETYWALSHPGTKADFHLRESFILEM
jgi:hypothetical protein